MIQQQFNASQKQNAKKRSTEEQKQDIKNAEYIARIGQPNHPNT